MMLARYGARSVAQGRSRGSLQSLLPGRVTMARADRLPFLPLGLRGEVVAPDVDVTPEVAESLSNNPAHRCGSHRAGGARRPSGAEEGVCGELAEPHTARREPAPARAGGSREPGPEAHAQRATGGAACRGRRGGGLSPPTSKEPQSLSDFCSGSELLPQFMFGCNFAWSLAR